MPGPPASRNPRATAAGVEAQSTDAFRSAVTASLVGMEAGPVAPVIRFDFARRGFCFSEGTGYLTVLPGDKLQIEYDEGQWIFASQVAEVTEDVTEIRRGWMPADALRPWPSDGLNRQALSHEATLFSDVGPCTLSAGSIVLIAGEPMDLNPEATLLAVRASSIGSCGWLRVCRENWHVGLLSPIRGAVDIADPLASEEVARLKAELLCERKRNDILTSQLKAAVQSQDAMAACLKITQSELASESRALREEKQSAADYAEKTSADLAFYFDDAAACHEMRQECGYLRGQLEASEAAQQLLRNELLQAQVEMSSSDGCNQALGGICNQVCSELQSDWEKRSERVEDHSNYESIAADERDDQVRSKTHDMTVPCELEAHCCTDLRDCGVVSIIGEEEGQQAFSEPQAETQEVEGASISMEAEDELGKEASIAAQLDADGMSQREHEADEEELELKVEMGVRHPPGLEEQLAERAEVGLDKKDIVVQEEESVLQVGHVEMEQDTQVQHLQQRVIHQECEEENDSEKDETAERQQHEGEKEEDHEQQEQPCGPEVVEKEAANQHRLDEDEHHSDSARGAENHAAETICSISSAVHATFDKEDGNVEDID